jgi:hypothetical protein
MFTRLFASAVIAAALAQGAFAQTTSTMPSQENTPNASSGEQSLPQELRSKLTKDGFSDVRIVPRSFLVSAKDKNGDDVMMVIGPHSMMMLTESSSQNTTTGSGSSSNGSGSSTQNK